MASRSKQMHKQEVKNFTSSRYEPKKHKQRLYVAAEYWAVNAASQCCISQRLDVNLHSNSFRIPAGPISDIHKALTAWPLKMAPVGNPEMSVSNHLTLRNDPEEGRPH
jgi:hypothetical protein